MSLNPNYEAIGKAFTQQYYALFDDAAQRHQLVNLYNAEQSLMTFEGQQMQGTAKIMEKISSLTFQKIAHLITAVDCQPTFDGGILINVLGQLKTDDDPAHSFTHTFVLKPQGSSWFIQHDIFRIAIHNTDDDPPQSFTQAFVLKPANDSFFIQHDIFRLALHNV